MADEDQKKDQSPKEQDKNKGEKGGQVPREEQREGEDQEQGWGPEATDLESR